MDWPIPSKPWQGVFLINFAFECAMIFDSQKPIALGAFVIFFLFCAPTFIIVYYVDKFLERKNIFAHSRDRAKNRRRLKK